MALNADDNEGVVEYSAMSGILYVTVDRQMLYTQKFNEHIKLQIVLNKNGVNSENSLLQDIGCEDRSSEDNDYLEEEEEEEEDMNFESNALSDTGDPETDNSDQMTLPVVFNKTVENQNINEDVLQRKQLNETFPSSVDFMTENRESRDIMSNVRSDSVARPAAKNNQLRKMNSQKTENNQSKKRKKKTKEDIICSYCLQSFKSRREYLNHHTCEKKSFPCSKCGKVLRFQAHLLIHMEDHEKMEAEDASTSCTTNNESDQTAERFDRLTSVIGTETLDKRARKCCICGAVMATLTNLKVHVMTHTGEYDYKCCVCKSLHRTSGQHKKHLVRHLRYRFRCKICNIRFDSRGELTSHQLTHPYPCNLCGKEFTNRTARYFHYKTFHKNDILKCPVCSKLYSCEAKLKQHMNYHQNVLKKQCPVCGISVSRLETHMRRKHGSRPDGTEINDDALFVCDKCPKLFTDKERLKRHLKTHSDEKPYECPECSKQFSSTGRLSRHLKIHLPDKPYVCEICGKACNRSGNLKVHMQSHSKRSDVGFGQKNFIQEIITADSLLEGTAVHYNYNS